MLELDAAVLRLLQNAPTSQAPAALVALQHLAWANADQGLAPGVFDALDAAMRTPQRAAATARELQDAAEAASAACHALDVLVPGFPRRQAQMLAFSKARYGGGVVGDAYHDPNVAMGHVYGATWSTPIPDMALLDNYVLMMATGFTGTAMDAFKKLAAWGSSKPKGGDEGQGAASRSASMASAASLASAASMLSTAGSA
ncbi:MAG: hypothetical protein J3K34DRAFT_466110 [Monoraphidium minutum]|nr:MAG: hypothetical protein J3K34DRAFT_466110 [Monoraphidium minutum]